MRALDYLLEQTIVYSLWQAPFAADKVAPILAHNNIDQVRRVLDVGCGPGTNTHLFSKSDYLGVEMNPRYVEYARKKFNRRFVVADVTQYQDDAGGNFDFVLLNSFLHHIDLDSTNSVLHRVKKWLSPDGYMHIIELTSPGDHSIAQFLADWDRGKFTRPLAEWREIFSQHLEIDIFEPFPVGLLGKPLWHFVYCRGKAKQ
jgi:SAM-dependent methyltransferase